MRKIVMLRRNASTTGMLSGIRRRIDLMRLVFSLLSAGTFTVFTLVMLFKDWASSVYLYMALGFVAAYMGMSGVLIAYIHSKGGRLNTSLKDYKSGLKIIKAVLRLIGFSITVSVLSIAVLSDATALFRFLVLVFSVVWAVIQIIYQLYKLIKRHKKKTIRQKQKSRPKRKKLYNIQNSNSKRKR